MNDDKSILQENEPQMYFKMSGGLTLLMTQSKFNRDWKSYCESRGETVKVEPFVEYECATFDQMIEDRGGKTFSVWYVYHNDRIVSIEYTRENSLTEKVDFEVVA